MVENVQRSAERRLKSDGEGVDPAEFRPFHAAGALHGGNSHLLSPVDPDGKSTWQRLAEGFTIGMRFIPRQSSADAKPVRRASSRRWSLPALRFADRRTPRRASRLGALCDFLARSLHSPVLKYTRFGVDIDCVIDVRAIFQQAHRDLKLDSVPAFLLPRKGRYGLTDYEKMFCPDVKSSADIFDLRVINRRHGFLVVVRRDQYVTHVLQLDEYAELESLKASCATAARMQLMAQRRDGRLRNLLASDGRGRLREHAARS